MKIEKHIKLVVTLTDDEKAFLNKAQNILRNVEREMCNYSCDTILCCDEFIYDIEELRQTICDLDMFTQITEVTN